MMRIRSLLKQHLYIAGIELPPGHLYSNTFEPLCHTLIFSKIITKINPYLDWAGELCSVFCELVRFMNSPALILIYYRKTSNISRTLVGSKIVDNSDVVGASPVGAAPTTSSFST